MTRYRRETRLAAKRSGRVSAPGVGVWTERERELFIEAQRLYPHGPWQRVADHVGTRTARQAMTHGQKLLEKQGRHGRGLKSPGRPRTRPEKTAAAATVTATRLSEALSEADQSATSLAAEDSQSSTSTEDTEMANELDDQAVGSIVDDSYHVGDVVRFASVQRQGHDEPQRASDNPAICAAVESLLRSLRSPGECVDPTTMTDDEFLCWVMNLPSGTDDDAMDTTPPPSAEQARDAAPMCGADQALWRGGRGFTPTHTALFESTSEMDTMLLSDSEWDDINSTHDLRNEPFTNLLAISSPPHELNQISLESMVEMLGGSPIATESTTLFTDLDASPFGYSFPVPVQEPATTWPPVGGMRNVRTPLAWPSTADAWFDGSIS